MFSSVGLHVSGRTTSEPVNRPLEVVLRAVPKESLWARSRYAWGPGPSGAASPGVDADDYAATRTPVVSAMAMTARARAPMTVTVRMGYLSCRDYARAPRANLK